MCAFVFSIIWFCLAGHRDQVSGTRHGPCERSSLSQQLTFIAWQEKTDRALKVPRPWASLARLFLEFNPATTWPVSDARVRQLRVHDAYLCAILSTADASDAASDEGAVLKGPDLKKLEHDVMSCSSSSWRAGRFGSGQRYTSGKQRCMDAIVRLESEFEDSQLDMANLRGRWQLIFTNDSVTRSSPFFWALKEISESSPINSVLGRLTPFGDPSKLYFSALDTLVYDRAAIGDAYQTIADEELINEVEVKGIAGSVVMTTASRWKASQGGSLDITVDTTQMVQMDVDKLLPDFAKLGNIQFPSGFMFERMKPGGSTVSAKMTFLSDDLRVTRHEDNVYVYRKISNVDSR